MRCPEQADPRPGTQLIRRALQRRREGEKGEKEQGKVGRGHRGQLSCCVTWVRKRLLLGAECLSSGENILNLIVIMAMAEGLL